MASYRSSDENGTRHGADTIDDTFRLVVQGLQHLQEAERKIQKALRLQKQEAEQNILEAQSFLKQEAEQKIQKALHTQNQEVRQNIQDALCLKKQEVEQMIQEALHRQKQEMEQNIQEALCLQKQETEQKLQTTLHLQKQEVKQMIQESLHIHIQEVEEKIQETLRLQKQEADQKFQEVLDLQERMEHRMQEAVRLQEQTAATALREMQLELQEKNATILTLQQRLQETQEKVTVLQEKTSTLEESGGHGGMQRLEDRMEKVESSLLSATQKFMPRVEAVLRQLEDPQSTRSSLAIAAASSYSSIPTSSHVDQQGAAADEQEREKQLINRRLDELELRAKRARISPCPLGEALSMATKEGRLSDVRRLIDSGADVNYTDQHYFTPLLEAVWQKNTAMVSLLLQRGADPNALDGYGNSALHMIAQRGESGPLMDMLVGAGGNVNARGIEGETPLHHAGWYNKKALVCAFLAAGARRDLKPWDGEWENKTPFDITTSPDVRNLLRL